MSSNPWTEALGSLILASTRYVMAVSFKLLFPHLLDANHTLTAFSLEQACFLDVFLALEVSGFAGNLRFLEILP